MTPSIAYDIRAGVGEARNDDIIEFSDGIYRRLEQWAILRKVITFQKNVSLHRG